MGQNETVHTDHKRQRGLLGNPEGLDMQIRRLLVVFGMELNPPGVPHRHGVLLIIPDVQRRGHGPVGTGEDDRQPHAGDAVNHFGHQQQALGSRGGVGPGPGRRGSQHHGGRRKLAFHVDEFGVQLPRPPGGPGLPRYGSGG